ncbi:hypothetical protein LEMLEM_LOCUS23468, partial [Lemmus lemmus]
GRSQLAQGLSTLEEGQLRVAGRQVRSKCSAPLPLPAVSLSMGRKVGLSQAPFSYHLSRNGFPGAGNAPGSSLLPVCRSRSKGSSGWL